MNDRRVAQQSNIDVVHRQTMRRRGLGRMVEDFSNTASGTLELPTVGEFRNGRGEFYSQDTINARAILVRFVISILSPATCQFEQAFSADGGKTWEVNWVATATRLVAGAAASVAQLPIAAVEGAGHGRATLASDPASA